MMRDEGSLTCWVFLMAAPSGLPSVAYALTESFSSYQSFGNARGCPSRKMSWLVRNPAYRSSSFRNLSRANLSPLRLLPPHLLALLLSRVENGTDILILPSPTLLLTTSNTLL